jgi:hypothetical protein
VSEKVFIQNIGTQKYHVLELHHPSQNHRNLTNVLAALFLKSINFTYGVLILTMSHQYITGVERNYEPTLYNPFTNVEFYNLLVTRFDQQLQTKSRADSFRFFTPEAVSKISCDYFTVTKQGHDGLTTSYPCTIDNNIDVSNSFYGFQYSLFSEELNYKIIFSVSLDTASSFHYDSSKLVSHIPDCIRKRQKCGFISRDSVLKLVEKKSKISAADFTDIDLEKNKKDGEFYWLISNHDKTNIVNAFSGKFINRRDFEYSW